MSAGRTPPQRSLKARALQLLAQREHSRAEMRRKLLVHARAVARVAAAALAAGAGSAGGAAPPAGATTVAASAATCLVDPPIDAPTDPPADPRAEVESTLDWLEAHSYLSQERFVESRVHARAARFGNLRIRQELKQHAVALTPEAAQALQASELARAHDVWSRKFPAAGTAPAERARQARFLAGRGFSPDVIRRLLRGAGTLPETDDPAIAGDD